VFVFGFESQFGAGVLGIRLRLIAVGVKKALVQWGKFASQGKPRKIEGLEKVGYFCHFPPFTGELQKEHCLPADA
jgi:hypothetical protein